MWKKEDVRNSRVYIRNLTHTHRISLFLCAFPLTHTRKPCVYAFDKHRQSSSTSHLTTSYIVLYPLLQKDIHPHVILFGTFPSDGILQSQPRASQTHTTIS